MQSQKLIQLEVFQETNVSSDLYPGIFLITNSYNLVTTLTCEAARNVKLFELLSL